ncbi:hypothetical protein Vi05172_g4401 [Venturia inaequalis]|nr:hypothetical protein Vi05172_g4401 [Venturia inaequalis]
MAPSNESISGAQYTAFSRSVTIRVNKNKKVEDPTTYFAHPALLIKTSGYFKAKLAQSNPFLTPNFRTLRPGTLQTYLHWIYSGNVSYRNLLTLDFLAVQVLQAPAFHNAIMDTLHASAKKGLSLFPTKGKLCPRNSEHEKAGMRRLMIDLMVWEFDDQTRDRQLSLCNLHFQRDVWRQCSLQKPGLGQIAPYAIGLDSYYESVGSQTPLFPIMSAAVDARHQKLHFEEMVTYIIGPEEQQFYVHPIILRASSKMFKPPTPPEVAKIPNGDPEIFQAFLEWMYFQIVPPKHLGFEYLFECYHFAELFELPRFADGLMSSIIQLFLGRMPIIDELHMVYDKTQEGSLLRSFLVDLMVWDADRYLGPKGPFPQDFIDAVLKLSAAVGKDELDECQSRSWITTPGLYILSPKSIAISSLSTVNQRRNTSHASEIQLQTCIGNFPPSPTDQTAKRGLFIINVPALKIKTFFGGSAQHIAKCYWLEDNRKKSNHPTFLVTFYSRAQADAAFPALPKDFKEKEIVKPNQGKTRPYVRWALPLPRFDFAKARVMTFAD